MVPNESIFNMSIESYVRIVDGVRYVLRKVGVENISMLAIGREDIFDREMEIMNVDDRE